MSVIVHIEKIILDGVELSAEQQTQLQLDLSAGLARFVADGFDHRPVDARPQAASLGLQVASAVYGVMGHLT